MKSRYLCITFINNIFRLEPSLIQNFVPRVDQYIKNQLENSSWDFFNSSELRIIQLELNSSWTNSSYSPIVHQCTQRGFYPALRGRGRGRGRALVRRVTCMRVIRGCARRVRVNVPLNIINQYLVIDYLFVQRTNK